MNLIERIRDAWGWIGLEPVEVVAENDFGNLIIRDASDAYWRLCPEECSCKIVAQSRDELEKLLKDSEFIVDWEMQRIVEVAYSTHGPLSGGRKYCLKIPGCLGGPYSAENYGTAPLVELVGFSGEIARQAKDLPDGAQVMLKVVQ